MSEQEEMDEQDEERLVDEAVDGFVDSNRALFEEYVRGWYEEAAAEVILGRIRPEPRRPW